MMNIGYKPFPKQALFHESPARFRALITGVGGGKTFAGSAEVINWALKYPSSIIYVVSPTFRMLTDITRRTIMELLPEEIKSVSNFIRGENRLVLPNNSEIVFRSSDEPQRLRGPTISAFWLDEARLMKREVWQIMIARIRQIGKPHAGWLTTTPAGFDWIWDEFVNKRRPDYEMINYSTRDNPYLDADYIKSLEDSYSGLFAEQEIEGQFRRFEGVVYPLFRQNVHVITTMPCHPRDVFGGIDWGFKNPQVCLICLLDEDDRMFIIDEVYERNMLLDDFVKVLKGLMDKYGVKRFYADPSRPDNIMALCQKGVPCIAANNDVMLGINEVTNRLKVQADDRARLYVHPRCGNLVKEFMIYRYREDKEGKSVKEEPLKIDDHACDVVRYIAMSRFNKDLNMKAKNYLSF